MVIRFGWSSTFMISSKTSHLHAKAGAVQSTAVHSGWSHPKTPKAAAISARSAVRKERCACCACIGSARSEESKQDGMQSAAVLLFHGLDLPARVRWTSPTRRKQPSQHSTARSAPLEVITAAPCVRRLGNYTPREARPSTGLLCHQVLPSV